MGTKFIYAGGGFDPESRFFIWHMINVNQMSPAHNSILYSIFFLMITQLITHLAPLAGGAGSAPITIISGNYVVAAVFLIFHFFSRDYRTSELLLLLLV